jgi:hypothetical protein
VIFLPKLHTSRVRFQCRSFVLSPPQIDTVREVDHYHLPVFFLIADDGVLNSLSRWWCVLQQRLLACLALSDFRLKMVWGRPVGSS